MQGVENKTNGRQGGHFNPAAQGEDSESSESDHAAPGETSTTTIKSQRRALATEVGGNFKVCSGIGKVESFLLLESWNEVVRVVEPSIETRFIVHHHRLLQEPGVEMLWTNSIPPS